MTKAPLGLTWVAVSTDLECGWRRVMTIWGVEWVAFQVTAWYLDQVTSAGTGTARHPLFFLGLPRGPAPGTRPLLPSSPPPPPPPFPLPPSSSPAEPSEGLTATTNLEDGRQISPRPVPVPVFRGVTMHHWLEGKESDSQPHRLSAKVDHHVDVDGYHAWDEGHHDHHDHHGPLPYVVGGRRRTSHGSKDVMAAIRSQLGRELDTHDDDHHHHHYHHHHHHHQEGREGGKGREGGEGVIPPVETNTPQMRVARTERDAHTALRRISRMGTDDETENKSDDDANDEKFEKDENERHPALILHRLRKVYPVRVQPRRRGLSTSTHPTATTTSTTTSTTTTTTKVAVRDLSLVIFGGETFGLLGPNGAGKTTAIQAMTGVTDVTNGEIYVDQYYLRTHPDAYLSRLGVCQQYDVLWPTLTPQEHLVFFARLRQLGDVRHVVSQALRGVRLDGRLSHRPVRQLSGGQKRRLSVALALLGHPVVVHLDEPATGLDPHSRQYLHAALRQKQRETGCAILVTTHCMEEAELLCDRVGVLVAGQLVDVGPPAVLAATRDEQQKQKLVLQVSLVPLPADGKLAEEVEEAEEVEMDENENENEDDEDRHWQHEWLRAEDLEPCPSSRSRARSQQRRRLLFELARAFPGSSPRISYTLGRSVVVAMGRVPLGALVRHLAQSEVVKEWGVAPPSLGDAFERLVGGTVSG